jgi:trk system potassium uptake protein TrkA
MQVIICGAGQVGSNIARYLSGEDADITIIDQSPELIHKIVDSLDVKGLVGFASHPDVLERAGARDADMVIAVTYADEVNMVACQICHSLFDVPTKIARVRKVIPLADGKVNLIGVHCTEECPILNTPLRQLTDLFPDLHIAVVGISRGDRGFVPSADDEMLPGDNVYFVAETEHLNRAMAAFGHEEQEARRVIVVGGGNIGLYLTKMVEEGHRHVHPRLIEIDKKRAEFVAQALERSVVIHGNALDTDILEEVNVRQAETLIAVSNDDEVNILSSLLAKRLGCRRAITLINKTTYAPLIGTLGIDAVVSPRVITVSTILQHVRRGRIRSVHTLSEGFGELIEAEALETSSLVGVSIREAKLPAGVVVAALVRDESIVIPRGDTVVRAGDLVVIFASTEAVKKVEKIFSVKLEFF